MNKSYNISGSFTVIVTYVVQAFPRALHASALALFPGYISSLQL